MAKWKAFPHDNAEYIYTPAALKKQWARLHAGDAEPLPSDASVLAAWALFHAGEFQKAAEAGVKAGGAGITVANKAQAIYANYLESSEKAKLALFMEVAERAEAQAEAEPKNANAHYFLAYSLGRYSQGISIAKALAQGLGSKVKTALETAIKLQPKHADAHIALGAFHAEVIDKVGALLGRTQGASKDAGLANFKTALKLNPTSAIAMVEYANGLVMLEGDKKMKEAEKLYADAGGRLRGAAAEEGSGRGR
jgi:tetratricopeptide (TPR) repeat protein